MPSLPAINVTTSSGAVPSIAKDLDRNNLIMRVTGSDVWFGFNEAAVADQGFFAKNGEALRVTGNKAKGNIYMITKATTSVVNTETTNTIG